MCVYITGFIPGAADLDDTESRLPYPLRRRLGVSFAPIDNPTVLSARPSGDHFVRFTGHRHCDCGVPLACGVNAVGYCGWWYYGREKGEYDLRQREERRHRRRQKDARRWLSFFRHLVTQLEAGHFGLLVHWGHDLEEFTFHRIDVLRIGEVTPEALMQLEQEVVYEFVQ
jgi:hypothetical protein